MKTYEIECFNVKGHKYATNSLNLIYLVNLLDQMSSKSSEYKKKPYTPGNVDLLCSWVLLTKSLI